MQRPIRRACCVVRASRRPALGALGTVCLCRKFPGCGILYPDGRTQVGGDGERENTTTSWKLAPACRARRL